MKTAFLFAGQGSQKPGMGRDLYESFAFAREVYDSYPEIRDVSFGGSAETLTETRNTQPVMGLFASVVFDLFRQRGITPDYTAGLSLGEYSALYSSGVFDRGTLVDLLIFRGAKMHECAAGLDSRMTAVLGLSDEDVEAAVSEVDKELGIVRAANYNCSGQTVIGGGREAVLAAEEICKRKGARRCVPLSVSGPFHTPFMQPVSEALREYFKNVAFSPMKIPLLFNKTGEEIKEDETVENLLVQQVKSPVLFKKIIENLYLRGVRAVVEIGPGKVLSGFVKKTAPEINCLSAEDCSGFETALDYLKGN